MGAVRLDRINRGEAFRYMGIRGTADEVTAALAEECEGRLLGEITPKYCWVTAEIEDISESEVTLSGYKLSLRGRDIAAHLSGCHAAALLCATLGNGADRLIRVLQAEDMAKALIADSFASAAVEQVCDIAEEEIRSRHRGLFTTWRFSPGYGDFPIETQRDFLAAANASRAAGICLSASRMLTPTKSVTAVIGISRDPIERKRQSCEACNLRGKCAYRKTGGHCGG